MGMDFDPGRGALSFGPGDVRRLRNELGLDQFPSASFSTLFCVQLYAMTLTGLVATFDVLDEVAALEGQRASHTKPAEQFKHRPMRGLWHKHFFTARNMVVNLLNQCRKPCGDDDWLGAQIDRLADESESGLFDTNKLAVAVTDGYVERHKNAELTGHWIIFALHEGRRYFLSVVRHARSRDNDEPIYRPIAAVCRHEFPFLGLEEVG
jgi:hypothetical protein